MVHVLINGLLRSCENRENRETKCVWLLCIFTGKHRKHPGGRGNAGGQHHHRINFDK